jgi:hypothetical protein
LREGAWTVRYPARCIRLKKKPLYRRGEKTTRSSASWLNAALPLAFTVVTNGFLTGIPNGTAKIAITPKSSLFPEMPFHFFFVHFPELNRRFLFQFSYDSQWRYPRFALNQTVKMVLVHFQSLHRKIGVCSNSLNNTFCLVPKVDEKLFAVFANKNQVLEDEKLGMAF